MPVFFRTISKRNMVAFVLAVLCAGCGNQFARHYVASPDQFEPIAVIAIAPFENLTDFPNAGEVVADIVGAELIALGRYKVIERETTVRLGAEAQLPWPPLLDRSFAAELGRKIQADALVIGSINEFNYRLDKSRQAPREPAVAVSVRMVNVRSGAVIWATTMSMSSYDMFSTERDPVNRIAQKIASQMARRLVAGIGGHQ
ncbi:MAG: hypothetical protein KIT79_13380 [Deltaproteobacteria bacterium]|nr:hypothetical protein [Deltaproteobacteria bacterium]